MTANQESTQRERATDKMRMQRLYQAVDDFHYNAALARHVYYLGLPHFTSSVETSCISVRQTKIAFEFNRSFFDSLGDDQLLFVLFHEALHYAFHHLYRRHNRISWIWNTACDLVVNAFLLEKAGFKKIRNRAFQQFTNASITFETLKIASNKDGLSLNAEEVYDLLANDASYIRTHAGDLTACDEHLWAQPDSECAMEDAFSIQDLADELKDAFRGHIRAWDDFSLGELRAIKEVIEPVKLSWDVILCRRMTSCIQTTVEQRWAPPARKTAWLYPEVLLPSDRESELLRSSILLALDTSGSISCDVLGKLLAIGKSIPQDKAEVTAVCFDAETYPLDIWAPELEFFGGGGTSFQAIEDLAADLPRYPDLIIVLTDGYAPCPSPQHPDRWLWLITDDGTTQHIQRVGSHCLIGDCVSK